MQSASLPSTGHPKGLYVLFFAEMWERFCYYGMRALLALYLVKSLAMGDEKGFAVYGAYTALVYAMPVIGGRIADSILGSRLAVLLGGILMAIGEFIIVGGTEQLLFWGMAVIIVGNGLFKPNISTMVGRLYPDGDARKDSGFTIFYIGINLGALLATTVVAEVGNVYGAQAGFALAGIGMLAGVLIFQLGGRHYAHISAPPSPGTLHQPILGPLSPFTAVIVGCLALVPVLYFLLRNTDIAGYVLLVVAIFVIGSLIRRGIQDGNGTAFRAPFSFEGRIRRTEYIMSIIGCGLVQLVIVILIQSDVSLLVSLLAIPFLWISFAQGAKRSHDLGNSGWFQLIPFYWVVLLTAKGKPLGNEYGENPRNVGDIPLDKMFGFIILMLFNVVFWACFEQAGSSLTLFAERNVDRHVFGWEMGAATTQFFNPAYILLFGSLFSIMWVELKKRNRDFTIPMKFGLGILQLGLGYLIVLVAAPLAIEYKVPLWTLAVLYMLHTTGELFLSPIGLSMVTKLVPKDMTGTAMGAWFLSIAGANYAAGLLARLTGVEHGGGEEGTVDAAASLATYLDVYSTMGWVTVGIGLLLIVLSPLINRLFHGIN
jgi:POT family proton-dependent oligopeptide transporter